MDETEKDNTRSARNRDAVYANYFQVGQNESEFLFEFGQVYEDELVNIHTRIITNPYYARAFLSVFQSAIEAYERDRDSEEET